jgi:hypothetical protein
MINVKELSTSLKNIEKHDNHQDGSGIPILFTCDPNNLDDDSSNETLMNHQSSSNRQQSNTTFNNSNFNSNSFSSTNSNNNVIELKKISDNTNNQTNHVEMDWNDQEFYQLCQEIVETDSLFNNNNNNNKAQQASNSNINNSQNNLIKHQTFDSNNIILNENHNQHSVLSLSTLKELQNQSQEPIMYIKQVNNSNTNGLNTNTSHASNNNSQNSNTYQYDMNHTQQIYLQQVQVSNQQQQQQYGNVIINHQGTLNDNNNQNKLGDPLLGRTITANHANNSIANQNSNNSNNNNFYIDNNSDANILTLPWDFENDFNTLTGYLQSPTI